VAVPSVANAQNALQKLNQQLENVNRTLRGQAPSQPRDNKTIDPESSSATDNAAALPADGSVPKIVDGRVEIPSGAPIPPYNKMDYAFDIVGLNPGDGVQSVRQMITEYFETSPAEKEIAFALGSIGSTQFTNSLSGSGNKGGFQESLSVAFSSPLTGGQAISIQRSMRSLSREEAPRITELLAALKSKYGEGVSKNFPGAALSHMWFFKDGKSVKCNAMCDSVISSGYTPTGIKDYVKQGQYPYDIRIVLYVYADGTFRERVSSVGLDLVDVKRRSMAADADIKFMNAANREAKKTPGALPNL
jgi:hypothetical protein